MLRNLKDFPNHRRGGVIINNFLMMSAQ